MKTHRLSPDPGHRADNLRALAVFGAGLFVLLAVFAAGAIIGRQSKLPAAPEQAPVTPAVAGERFLVEVAVVENRSEAERIVTQLRRQYTSAWISGDSGARLFHVYVGPYPNADQANTVRNELADQGMQPTVVKAPGPQASN